jgi:hypothetical protein
MRCTVLSLSTTARWRIAVGGSCARCHGSYSYMSVAVSRNSDRSTAGFPVDCWWGSHRCGPTPTREAGPTTSCLRYRTRSSPTGRRRDTVEYSDGGGCRPTPRRIRANVSYWCRAEPTPDMRCHSRLSDCALRVLNHNRDTVSRVRRYDRLPTLSVGRLECRLSLVHADLVQSPTSTALSPHE